MAGGEDPNDVVRSLPMGRRISLIEPGGRRWSGTVVPVHEFSRPGAIQLKLDSGYNVGLYVGKGWRVELRDEPPGESQPPTHRRDRVKTTSEEWVALLTTGGTIASRVDYQTGGVKPVETEAELLDFFPELTQEGDVRVTPVLERLSENIGPLDWSLIAEKTHHAFVGGARGVVITHGTDTLGFTAAALGFMVTHLPGPVILVGAQRSPDRPSSDGPPNLMTAVRVALRERFGEVVVLMHAGLSDDRFALHRGTRVRKMHSSRRDAFETRNGLPVGFVDSSGVHWNEEPKPVTVGPPRLRVKTDSSVGLLWSYPGLEPERAEAFAKGRKGLVIAGTGLGHTAAAHLPWIRSAVEGGTTVVMTTQCLAGLTDGFVYSTGRELLRAGVLFVEDLLPETAYVKLVWILGEETHPAKVRERLFEDVAGEFAHRRPLLESP